MATNQFSLPQTFNNATWDSPTYVTDNATTAPDTTTTAASMLPASTFTEAVRQTITTSITGDNNISIYIKANGFSKVFFREQLVSGNYAVFDLSTVALIEASGTTSTAITDAGGGWYRISGVQNLGSTASRKWAFGIATSTYTTGDPQGQQQVGDGASGVYIWGALLTAGATLEDYFYPVYSAWIRA
jgi:hypothetical protein